MMHNKSTVWVMAGLVVASCLAGCSSETPLSSSSADVSATTVATAAAADAAWRDEFGRVRDGLVDEVLAVGQVMSHEELLSLLLGGDGATRARLDTHLDAIIGCATALDRLPRPSRALLRAASLAGTACSRLQAAAALVGVGLGTLPAQGDSLGTNVLISATKEFDRGMSLFEQASVAAGLPPAAVDVPAKPPTTVPTNAAGTFEHRCAYLLGDFSETASGYRFVGDVDVNNTGLRPLWATVTMKWEQIGTAPVSEFQRVGVGVGKSKHLTFERIANADSIDRHQKAEGECTASLKVARGEAEESYVRAKLKLIELGTWINAYYRSHGCADTETDECFRSILPVLTQRVATTSRRLHPRGRAVLVNAVLEVMGDETETRPGVRLQYEAMQRALLPLLKPS